MKHLIMGTAGHIDHGKTALVKLLTHIDCDTHPEEKARGITINLGFSHLDDADARIGIIDVPGHSDFVNTMIAGAFGVDLVMLVIAADSGVMPQTVEHLRIMQMLGVGSGLVAVTKIDRVDADLLGLAVEEIRAFIAGTFLEGCAIVPVSSKTGEGERELREAIRLAAASCRERKAGSYFRMFIDRIFSVSGAGTVVTGTSLGGSLRTEDMLYLLPGAKKLRVRRIEQHGARVEATAPRSRVSINLTGLDRNDFRRGMAVSQRPVRPSSLFDASLETMRPVRSQGCWMNALVCLGTYTGAGRLHLIDTDALKPGEPAIVQVQLDEPAPVMRGDRFIVRNTSGDMTLGGGEVIDAFPLHHRRRPEELVAQLRGLASGGTAEFIINELSKKRLVIPVSELSDLLAMDEAEICSAAEADASGEIIMAQSGAARFVLSASNVRSFEMKIVQLLGRHHAKHPLDECGKTKDELMGVFKGDDRAEAALFLDQVLGNLAGRQQIRVEQNTYVLEGHAPVVAPAVKEAIDQLERLFSASSMHLLSDEEALAAATQRGISSELYGQIMRHLVAKKRVACIQGHYVHARVVDDCKRRLLQFLRVTGQGVTVATFRDMTDGNRKMCLLLLNHFDELGLTLRNGDCRTITERGCAWLEEQAAEQERAQLEEQTTERG